MKLIEQIPIILKKGDSSAGIDFEAGAAILVDKPAGITSFGVVSRLRRSLKVKKAGHTGTLDPAATGLLILLTGKATRTQAQFMSLDKEYRATVILGIETDTWDLEGEVVSRKQVSALDSESIASIISERFQGELVQTPPVFSAIKINGVPSHRRIRKGQQVKLEPRKVHAYEIKVVDWNIPEITLTVHCSSGFYVRSLAHDLGVTLGCGATLKHLIRTKIGVHSLDDAFKLDDLLEQYSNVKAD
jgi:tRNA pseudouridine55 synthase